MRYRIHFLGLLAVLLFPKWGYSQIYTWANGLPSANNQEIFCSTLDPSGNLIIVGEFSGTVDFDPSGGTANKTASGTENAFIAKYSPTGAFMWVEALINNSNGSNNNNSRIKSVTTTANGDIYVAGSFNGEIDFNPDNNSARESSNGTGNANDDFFIARYNGSGVYQRHMRRGNNENDEATGIIVQQNKVYVMGTFKTSNNPIDFDPSNGFATRFTQGNLDGFIARYDLNFNFEAVETFGGNNDDTPHSFAIDNSGDILITGRTNSSQMRFQSGYFRPAGNVNADVFLVKYTLTNPTSSSPIINCDWGFALEGASRKEALAVAVDASSNVYIAGRYDQTFDADPNSLSVNNLIGNSNFNSFLIKYNTSGGFMAATSLSDNAGTGYDAIHDIKITNSHLYFTGVFNGTVIPANGSTALSSISSVGSNDVMVGRCNHNLEYDWVFGIGSPAVDQGNSILVSGTDFYISGIYSDTMDCNPNPTQSATLAHSVGVNADMFFAKYSVCIQPTNPSIANAIVSVCQGSAATLTRTGGTLGSATNWAWFTNSCSGTQIATGDVLTINPVTSSEIYYVKAIGGCVTPSNCATAEIRMDSTPTAIITANDITNARCSGANNGRLGVTVQGGTPSYSYLWSAQGSTDAFAASLFAGSYSVTVTDAKGCKDTVSAVVSEPNPLGGTITKRDVSCFGRRDGDLLAVPVGGTSPYSYTWSTTPAETTARIDTLIGGNYQLTILDALGCVTTTSAIVNEPSLLSATINIDTNFTFNPSLCGGADGQLTIVPSGGTSPYSFAIPGRTTTNSSIDSLNSAIYNITVTDNNNCQTGLSHTLTEPSTVSVSTQSANIACFSGAQGELSAIASGGMPSYNYVWTTLQNDTVSISNIATGLLAGVYRVRVTDGLDCSVEEQITLSQPSALNDTIAVTNATCATCNDGSVIVILQGGTPPYTYEWSNGRTSAFIANILPGNFTVFVADSSGCRDTLTIIIGITVGVNQLASSSIQIFPNPNRGLVYVKNLPTKRRLSLINALGQIIWYDENPYSDTQIDMHAFPAALYWLRVETDADSVQIPIVKSNE